MTTEADGDLQQCEVCFAYHEITDPNVLDYYVHLHLKPEEVIDQLTVPALHEYLVAVIGERWPDQLLLKYGVDGVRLGPSWGYSLIRPDRLRRKGWPHPYP